MGRGPEAKGLFAFQSAMMGFGSQARTMRYTDIAIVGGGLAGSTAAAMLSRAGIPTILVDPHPIYPPDFRVEKLSGHEQIERFRKTGIAAATLRSATHDGENWIARFGYLLDKKPSEQYGIMYDALVNAIRAEIQGNVETVYTKVTSISPSPARQKVVLANGEEISARLVVLANGLSVSLRNQLGIGREVVSPCHSISLGFDLAPVGRASFPCSAMTYFSERSSDRIPYITLFPIGSRMRANLFVYRQMEDPWLRQMRRAPEETLNASLPRLRRLIGDFAISTKIEIRPADMYESSGYRQAGIVMVGDAFKTTCPVTGTGTDKVFTDVERLCHVHIPAWLATKGMDAKKICAFYDDPIKVACDAWSIGKSYSFRSVTLDNGPYWRMHRLARFFFWLGQGTLRRVHKGLAAQLKAQAQSASSSSLPSSP
jgi:2-polyprenyl-6-methoxyphenol hydroxylase-like FAD-dependent oxidoreductase